MMDNKDMEQELKHLRRDLDLTAAKCSALTNLVSPLNIGVFNVMLEEKMMQLGYHLFNNSWVKD